jgi:hypothetical protein
LRGDGLGLRIESGKTFEVSRALGKEGNQAPAHQQQLAHSAIAAVADHRLKCGRRNVVIGDDVGKVRRWIGSEALSNPLLI